MKSKSYIVLIRRVMLTLLVTVALYSLLAPTQCPRCKSYNWASVEFPIIHKYTPCHSCQYLFPLETHSFWGLEIETINEKSYNEDKVYYETGKFNNPFEDENK